MICVCKSIYVSLPLQCIFLLIGLGLLSGWIVVVLELRTLKAVENFNFLSLQSFLAGMLCSSTPKPNPVNYLPNFPLACPWTPGTRLLSPLFFFFPYLYECLSSLSTS